MTAAQRSSVRRESSQVEYLVLAARIHQLVAHEPFRAMRVDPAAGWGISRLGVSDTLALHLPGCLAVLQGDPGMPAAAAIIRSGSLARALADTMALKPHGGRLLVRMTLDEHVWRDCVLVDGRSLPWYVETCYTDSDEDRELDVRDPTLRSLAQR